MDTSLSLWISFNLFFLMAVCLDLWLHNKKAESSTKRDLCFTLVWVGTAMIFNVIIYLTHGQEAALSFLTGYLIEETLSIDNLFVFMLIFNYFHTPKRYMHRVLFYGILGAVLMRASFIFGGIAVIEHFSWSIYILALFLIFAGIRMFFKHETKVDPGHNPLLIGLQRWFPFTHEYHNGYFFVQVGKCWLATPLFATLVLVEFTDLVFALDSIPAILAITRDPFIVYTSNVFAILGLRALFSVLSSFLELFHYLYMALAAILTFIGFKMLIMPFYHIPTGLSLSFVVIAISIACFFSLHYPRPPRTSEDSSHPTKDEHQM